MTYASFAFLLPKTKTKQNKKCVFGPLLVVVASQQACLLRKAGVGTSKVLGCARPDALCLWPKAGCTVGRCHLPILTTT